MPFSPRTRGPLTPTRPTPSSGGAPRPRDHRSGRGRTASRAVPVALLSAAALVVGGAGVAFADAHKTVTLDVDGTVVTLDTFAGSVDGVLDQRGVDIGAHDTVAPAGPLDDGATIVVRHARTILVSADGEERTVWTTALTADEALETLDARTGGLSLVASRSSGGRPELSLDLTLHGPAEVLVDGTVLTAPDGDARVADVLDELGVTLGELDTVRVQHSDQGRVQVVVQRVVVQDVTTTSEVAYASVTQDDASRYTGTTKVVTAGVPGVRTVVDRVTTVDGVETARTTLSDTVTQAPVDEVVAVGTKARPAPVASSSSSAPAAGGPIAAGGDADSLNWAALAACESGGNPTIVSSNGLYHGLYQFSVGTWRAVGGAGLPSAASADEQTARAKMLYNRSGAGQWPHCGPRLFSSSTRHEQATRTPRALARQVSRVPGRVPG
ncbi:transglycosylase family protein [Cellulomonas soli]